MLKVAVIGPGFIGSVHAKNFARHPGAELVAVSDANIEMANKVALATGARAESDVEEVFSDKDIQAVLIATTTDTHVDFLSRAADAGKAIYCEKPISLDYEEAEKAVQAVRGAGVPVMLGFNRRFDASHAAVKEAVEQGEVGKVEIVQLTSRGPKPRRFPMSRFPEASSGIKQFIFLICCDGSQTMNRSRYTRSARLWSTRRSVRQAMSIRRLYRFAWHRERWPRSIVRGVLLTGTTRRLRSSVPKEWSSPHGKTSVTAFFTEGVKSFETGFTRAGSSASSRAITKRSMLL